MVREIWCQWNGASEGALDIDQPEKGGWGHNSDKFHFSAMLAIGSLVRIEGVNRPIKIQLKLNSNSPMALPLYERGTTAPA